MIDEDPLEQLPPEVKEENRNYYELLDVGHDAQQSDIKQKYKEKIREFHPDTNNLEYAEEMTFALNEARKVLLNQSERMLYNEVGHDRYHNQSQSTNMMVQQETDISEYEMSVYDYINMAKLTKKTGEAWYITVLKSTGFKLTVVICFSFVLLFGILAYF